MGERVLVVQSNVETTDDNWTGLGFKIWIPVKNLNAVEHEQYINLQPVGGSYGILPLGEPAAQGNVSLESIPQDRQQLKLKLYDDGNKSVNPQDLHRPMQNKDLAYPVTADSGRRTVQSLAIPQDQLPQYRIEKPEQMVFYESVPLQQQYREDDRSRDYQGKSHLADPATGLGKKEIEYISGSHSAIRQDPQPKPIQSKPEIPQHLLRPKTYQKLELPPGPLPPLRFEEDDRDHDTHRLEGRAHIADPTTSVREKPIENTYGNKSGNPQHLHHPKPNQTHNITSQVSQDPRHPKNQVETLLGDKVYGTTTTRVPEESTRPPRKSVQGISLQETEQNNQVSIDIHDLAQIIRDDLKILNPLSDFLCIYKVSDHLRDLNENAYKPHIVSIGPFHHGKPNLATMEDVKKRYLQHFLTRNNVTVEQLFEETFNVESKLRGCYAETIEFSNKDFLKMMVLDGCFIVEYLLRRHFRDWESNDPVFNKQRMTNTIRFDLLLLENQIPFFYIEKLFSMSNNYELRRGSVSMVKLVRRFLEESTGWDWLAKDFNDDQEIDVQHILHYLSILLLPKQPRKGQELKIRASPSIVDLHSAGVKFKSSTNRHFLDIQFKNGILEIPTWKINDQTEVLFRNILAFELCNPPQHYLSDYIALVDMLINVEQDVEVLVRNGIIENLLQENQSVADLVNNLGKNNLIYDKDFYFSGLVEELKRFCESPCNKWKATLKQEYFKNPWTVISVIAAAFLLLLTILQSVCSVLQVL